MKKLVYSLLAILWGLGSVYAQNVLELKSFDKTRLDNHFQYYIDSSNQGFEQLTQQDFAPIGDQPLRLGITTAHIWLRLQVKNSTGSSSSVIIEFDDPSIYEIVLYDSSNVVKVSKSGAGIPQQEKGVKGNKNNFKVTLHKKKTHTLYFRVSSKTSMTLSAYLEKYENAIIRYANESVMLGLYYGMIGIFSIFSFLLFIISRARVFIFYGLYVISVGAFTAVADGLFQMYFNTFVVFTNGYFDVLFFTLSNTLGVFFMLEFLRVKQWNKRLYKGAIYFIVSMILLISILFFISKSLMFTSVKISSLLAVGVYLYYGYTAVKRKIRQANYYLLAYCLFGGFILIFTLSLFRVIPFSVVVQYAIHIGYALSMIVLSYGLLTRLYVLYQRLIEKEKEKQELIKQKNKELEEKVAERTATLTRKEINLRAILDNTDSSIWLVDSSYKLIDFNRVFAFLWKIAYGNQLKRGDHVLDLMPDSEVKDSWRSRYAAGLNGEKGVFVDSYEYSGKQRYFEIRTFPISESGKITGVSVFSKDITEQLKAEHQLKTQNQMLKKVNKELDSFVYSASHDLKAPLVSILGLINLVKNEADMEARMEYYSMMEKSVVRLDTFIKDIIDYSRNERTDIVVENIDLKEMLETIFADLKYLNGADEITRNVKLKGAATFKNDKIRVKVALRNLLSNAIRYGCAQESKRQIDITANINEDKAVISIQDYGPGISEKHRPHIFEMFYRAHERTEGTGLGLYIVKETLEKINGEIALVDNQEAGCLFVLTIPNCQ